MEIKTWRRGHEIGRSSCATVSVATNPTTGEVFAVKTVPLSGAMVLRREKNILSALNSPFIISCLGSDISKDSSTNQLCYNLFMEYAPGGSLSDKVSKQHGGLKESFIRSRTFEILSGLVYLHDIGIVHCDIKGQNVLVGSDGRAKIADFGCAKIKFCEIGSPQIRGTPMYMAPEVARGEEQGAPADMWALGCTVLEMVSGGVPWAGFSDPFVVLQHIGYSSDVPVVPSWISDEAKDFLSKCLIREPDKRWSAEQLINHPFIATSDNSMSEKSLTESCVSPMSILDQGMWESLTHNLESEQSLERIGMLAGGTTAGPAWSDDEDWITVRCKGGDAFVADASTTSGGEEEEVNLVGDHMETEEFQFKPHGCGDFLGGNFNFLEGGKYHEKLRIVVDRRDGSMESVERNLTG
ncbi:mitogen-activated protein kinase kinase kinase 2-like protein [Carex littledalei]|uniref:Mitogen-activated protein kinase kinase kinase 2-like protein n=1 Tax=Carex littledalei TaxID=544730 RepID=A0A833QSM2_9POAL|nr:mitogen-activated protein kinase kinase kinase 2-like protein [Carex littledalei]